MVFFKHTLLISIFLIGFLYASCQTVGHKVENYGARADAITDNTAAIQKAIDDCHEKGGGTVILTNGIYLSGTIHLKSNVVLHIAHAATLKAIQNAEAFPRIQGGIPSRMDKVPWKAFIRAENVSNISITGGGTIDGSGDATVFANSHADSPERPYGILMINCENVRVENVYMHSSAFWMQRYFHCTGVKISGIQVFNHVNLNNDGLDIDSSQDVIVSDCIIDSSDDALVIKSEGKRQAKNIVVTNCILATHASAIKLGTGSVGGYEHISISNIVIRKSKATEVVHPLGLAHGLTGIDLTAVDGGAMRNIQISNVSMDGLENPIHIRLGNRQSDDVSRQSGNMDDVKVENDRAVSVVEDILITNIMAKNMGAYPVVIAGFQDHPVKRVTIKDVIIQSSVAGDEKDIERTINWEPHWYPFIYIYNSRMPAYGIVTHHTEDIVLENFKVIPAQGDPRPEAVHIH